RVRMNPNRVQDLAELLERGVEFKDDVEVYLDDDGLYWVGDGFHRLEAYQRAKRAKVWAFGRPGTHRGAEIDCAGANADHGEPRPRKCIRRAVKLLLEDDQLRKLSDRTLSKIARCDHKTVGSVREELGLTADKVTITDKHGNETEMDVSNLRGRTVGACGP